jgi:tight adherence protein C
VNIAARLIVATLLGAGGVWLTVSGLSQRRPSLEKMTAHLGRAQTVFALPADGWGRLGRTLVRRVPMGSDVVADLRLIRRTQEVHAAYLVSAAVASLFGPSLLATIVLQLGLISTGLVLPLVVSVICAIAGPLAVHSNMRSKAAHERNDLRYQLSSYLDVVTMLLAGNVGNEGALRQAAQAGDGRLFVELRRRILVAETSNRSLVSALGQLGDDLDLVELQQISASASLAASAGAPVARSLAAKCATLRSALSAEQETEARVRTGKITVPLVGMSLLIMAAVVYPALNFSR